MIIIFFNFGVVSPSSPFSKTMLRTCWWYTQQIGIFEYHIYLHVFLNKKWPLDLKLLHKNIKENSCQCGSINRVFFWMNSIHGPFVIPELINTTCPEKSSTLYAIFSQKKYFKFQQLVFFFCRNYQNQNNMRISDICTIDLANKNSLSWKL